MANILHMFELARKKPEIICLSVHPGGVRTNIGSNYMKKLGFFGKILEFVLFGIMRWCWRTPFQGRELIYFYYFNLLIGAQTSLYCAIEKSLTVSDSGKYFYDCREAPVEFTNGMKHKPRSLAVEEITEFASKLWNISEEVTKSSL